MKLVIQSFGREAEYRRAIFTLLSFRAFCEEPVMARIYTDNPDFFAPYLKEIPHEFCLLTPEKIADMRGEINFLHRMKIVLIEESLQTDSILYCDSDTFFTATPGPLIESLTPEVSYMHKPEYPFSYLAEMELPAAETFHAFLQLVRSQHFTMTDGLQFEVKDEDYSWNAGVMLLHRDLLRWLPYVYQLTDYWYPASRNHASEQYAFSVVLNRFTRLQPCESVIWHYWHRISKEIMDGLLLQSLDSWAKLSPARLRDLCVKLPARISRHYRTLQDQAIQQFHLRNWWPGVGYACRALIQHPRDIVFISHLGYHALRFLRLRK